MLNKIHEMILKTIIMVLTLIIGVNFFLLTAYMADRIDAHDRQNQTQIYKR